MSHHKPVKGRSKSSPLCLYNHIRNGTNTNQHTRTLLLAIQYLLRLLTSLNLPLYMCWKSLHTRAQKHSTTKKKLCQVPTCTKKRNVLSYSRQCVCVCVWAILNPLENSTILTPAIGALSYSEEIKAIQTHTRARLYEMRGNWQSDSNLCAHRWMSAALNICRRKKYVKKTFFFSM